MEITRRQFNTLLAATVLAQATGNPQTTTPKWNVLMITNDQHRADGLGCMGNPMIQTPNVDRLAQASVLFEQHFVQARQP